MLKNPNRIAAYITAVAALLGGLAPVIADLDVTSTAGVLAGVVGIVAVFRGWLVGWQQMERADYQAQLQTREHLAAMEAQVAAREVGRAGSGPKVRLPR